MKNIIVLLITIFLLVSCTKQEKNYTVKEIDGVKTFMNNDKPADPNYKITPKKILTIQLNENNPDTALANIAPRNLCTDKEKNIYIVDPRKATIHKLDSNGKYVKSFGNKGSGPGEMNVPLNLAVMSDTLYVFDYNERKTNIFDLDGNFIKAVFIASNEFFYFISKVNEESFTGILAVDRYGDEGVFTVYEVPIFSRQSKRLKILHTREEFLQPANGQWDPAYLQPAYTVGDNKIFVLENSSDNYRISVFNESGEHLYNIRKNYRKLKIEDIDSEDFGEVGKKFQELFKYKRIAYVFGMHVTKDGYLLVQRSMVRNEKNKYDYIVDAFKDGVYINTFNLGVGKTYDYYIGSYKRWFIDDRIYYVNYDEGYLDVYEY